MASQGNSPACNGSVPDASSAAADDAATAPAPDARLAADDAAAAAAAATAAAPVVAIDLAPAAAAADGHVVGLVAALVNRAYTDAEVGIFDDSYRRASEEDIARSIRRGHLALAHAVDARATGSVGGGGVVGCVCVKLLSPRLGGLSMLAVDARHCGGGLGRRLVLFAEQHCRRLGCTAMQLELVVPTASEHAVKARMQAWYLRMGYRVVRLGDFAQAYPALAPLLLGPVEYRIFEKDMMMMMVA